MSQAGSIDNVGIIGRLQCGGTMEMREVMQRELFSNRVSSSTILDIPRASGPAESRIDIDSALPRKGSSRWKIGIVVGVSNPQGFRPLHR